MGWTKEQSKVIETRGKNILVSAAAGSGKTSVLVERIIQRVCDENNPIDIDRILVVTFTNAAAGEMKERIYRALKNASERDPENERLKKQVALCFSARISTIDSFCVYLIKNYFHESGIEPGMKIADAAMTGEIRALVMKELLEEHYEAEDDAFISFCDDYARRERDYVIEDMISSLFDESESYPYPKEFFKDQRRVYDMDSIEDLSEKEWIGELLDYTKKILLGIRTRLEEEYKNISEYKEHPYIAVFESDLEMTDRLLLAESYQEYYEAFLNLSFMRAPSKKYPGEEKEERDALRAKRDALKNEIKKLGKMFESDMSGLFEEMMGLKSRMDMLISLTEEFSDRYKAEKEKRNIMEFSDVEHYALDILIDPKTGERTESAKLLSKEFEEVMVDEYQDSNLLQESLLLAVTSQWRGISNYFMVGDVKQSIYRFRQARPDIFMGKYLAFRKEEAGENVAIDLDSNFRSRKEVLYSVNALFEKLMKPDMGGIDYDDKAALKYMGSFEEGGDYKTTLIVADADGIDNLELRNKDEYEAYVIAGRIMEMVKNGASFSDIVILHRSANAIGTAYKDIFRQFDIPAVVVSNTGYFSSVEVEVLLALFKVLTNPVMDIPLVSVMKSIMFCFTDEDLANIRLYDRKNAFCETVFAIADMPACPDNIPVELYEKIKSFTKKISEWRKLSGEIPVYKLINRILAETGYDTYIAALPEGDVRKDNIQKLISMAISYGESCNIREFVRYIERINKYEKQVPATAGGAMNAVSIMTIHKSKGLEFPIVFLAGCGRNFNIVKDTLVIGKDLGIATALYDAKRRIKSNTLFKKFISEKNHNDDLGEEQRLLYVAMTRAKEKLFITGVTKNAEKLYDKSEKMEGEFSFSEKSAAKCYLQWLLPVAVKRKDVYSVELVNWEDTVKEQALDTAKRDVKLTELLEAVENITDEEIRDFAKDIEYEYPRPFNEETKIKYSVSELKRKAMEENLDEDEVVSVFSSESEEHYLPLFISGKTHHISGAARGTAVHRYMECFDFSLEDLSGSYEAEKQRMEEQGFLTPDESNLLVKKEIEQFLCGDLCRRMHEACLSGVLQREAAFIMSGEDDILIQGIIDVFFEEDDGIVLVDYKTDRIDNDGQLVARYEKQMELYKDAIERTHEKKVKEIILYSFCLGREIHV